VKSTREGGTRRGKRREGGPYAKLDPAERGVGGIPRKEEGGRGR